MNVWANTRLMLFDHGTDIQNHPGTGMERMRYTNFFSVMVSLAGLVELHASLVEPIEVHGMPVS